MASTSGSSWAAAPRGSGRGELLYLFSGVVVSSVGEDHTEDRLETIIKDLNKKKHDMRNHSLNLKAEILRGSKKRPWRSLPSMAHTEVIEYKKGNGEHLLLFNPYQ